ncbi:MAG: rRNA pseudouridine synthase [Clostridia bacterium]|nr:rRNA pseudouridine synthase [Clostridia bacterium]
METVRLQKYLAECGVASRRKSEEYITSGFVKVNGKVVTELGTKIDPEIDKVEVISHAGNIMQIIKENSNVDNSEEISNDSQIELKPEKKVYILLNKPVGYVTTVNDEKGRSTVMELLKDVKEKVVPVGRLDMFTSGLLLFSNDGEFINKVTHPKHETTKTYIVKTRGVPKEKDLEKLRNGVKIEEYITSPAKVELLLKDNTNDVARIWIQIHEGRNRQVRKMCEAIGLSVIALKREGVGNLTCEGVNRGEWRYLTEEEVQGIMNN